jgi:ribosomal protein S18 acetylase RimI-like enzyme
MEPFIRPAGPADAEEIAAVQRISWRATYSRLLSPESMARVAVAWDAAHWRNALERTDDRTVSLVLEGRDTGIIGFGVAGPRRGGRDPLLRSFAGEIYLLYLLPTAQKQGHGVQLMTSMARVLRARGMDSALVWALASNRAAIGFYQHLAGTVVMQCARPFFGERVDEIALGWRDLRVLSGKSQSLPD